MTNGNPAESPLIVIASNRGPYSFHRNEKGELIAKRGAGGLVTALAALAEQHDVLWIASALSKEDRQWAREHTGDPVEINRIMLKLVQPKQASYDQYYNTIANPLLWFIQHEMWNVPRTPSITEEIWQAWRNGYVAVNKLFADAIAKIVGNLGHRQKRRVIIMPQDYHLYMVPQYLRERLGDQVQIQPFLHIPWPGPDAWRILPERMRTPIFNSMLQSDRLGFQTKRDAFNFVQTCRFYLDDAHSRGSRNSIEYQGRKVFANHYPISIDVEKVAEIAENNETRLTKNSLMSQTGDFQVILRTDRVEPSKNILRGLEAYETLLEKYPEHRGRVQLMQLLVPSRLGVEEYAEYLRDIMSTAGMINAKYANEFWEPVRTIVGNNYPRALAAMQIYSVLLVNPIADGMNLVAKEGVFINQRDGVLVLSENAGAYYELGDHALTVSPYDIYGTSEAMHEALTMGSDERSQRAEALRAQVRDADVRAWFASQVDDALRALTSQDKNASTSSTPEAVTSEDSSTTEGVSSPMTPSATE